MNEPRGYTTPDDPTCDCPNYEQCDRCGRLVCPLCEGLCDCPDEGPEEQRLDDPEAFDGGFAGNH